MPPPRALLDASALVAWFLDEKGAETIERLLPVCAISAVNQAEALERTAVAEWDLANTVADLRAYGLTVLPFEAEDATDVPMIRKAGRQLPGAQSGRSALSLGDCCCLAAAARRDLPVITDDSAWIGLNLGVKVHLFR
jgi:PIN domain nuclease of toxin-antitoxin system